MTVALEWHDYLELAVTGVVLQANKISRKRFRERQCVIALSVYRGSSGVAVDRECTADVTISNHEFLAIPATVREVLASFFEVFANHLRFRRKFIDGE